MRNSKITFRVDLRYCLVRDLFNRCNNSHRKCHNGTERHAMLQRFPMFEKTDWTFLTTVLPLRRAQQEIHILYIGKY